MIPECTWSIASVPITGIAKEAWRLLLSLSSGMPQTAAPYHTEKSIVGCVRFVSTEALTYSSRKCSRTMWPCQVTFRVAFFVSVRDDLAVAKRPSQVEMSTRTRAWAPVRACLLFRRQSQIWPVFYAWKLFEKFSNFRRLHCNTVHASIKFTDPLPTPSIPPCSLASGGSSWKFYPPIDHIDCMTLSRFIPSSLR